MERIPLTKLDAWLVDRYAGARRIDVSGGVRRWSSPADQEIPLLELAGVGAHTAKVLIPVEATQVKPATTAGFECVTGDDWWNAWAPVLVACGLMAPVVDPRRLLDLLHERRRLRFYCDTNSLCRGITEWLVGVLEGRADVVTSAVVDRELHAWPDRDSELYAAKTVKRFVRRTQLRLARRFTENTVDGLVVDRLSPDQNALVMVKYRDETEGKSPDADMLLIELARELVRDQPGNARVIYVTGDRNNARAALNALGAQGVLYAVADAAAARRTTGCVLARGWWHPRGPLGSLCMPSTARLLWHLLAACEYLVVSGGGDAVRIAPVTSVRNGVPSDWADPWLELAEHRATVPTVPQTGSPASPTAGPAPTVGNPAPTVDDRASAKVTHWLLPPVLVGAAVVTSRGWRPPAKCLFGVLWAAINGVPAPADQWSEQLQDEAERLLSALGALDPAGRAGPRLPEFAAAWRRCDLDWFHAELMRTAGYRATVESVRAGDSTVLGERQQRQLSLCRNLGQAARLDRNGPVRIGDRALSEPDLVTVLRECLPQHGDSIATEALCTVAMDRLGVTPFRLEVAITRLWSTGYGREFEGQTGGSVRGGYSETVVELSSDGLAYREVAPGALWFGRDEPVRFIVRIA